jgi:L-ascorbate metabolism protein UlaG (beta-lactamase superfamily)
MRIKWLGHSCFLITSEGGVRIVTDPYLPGLLKGIKYRNIDEAAEIVTVSHEHSDHNNVADVPGNPEVVRGAGSHQVKGIEFKGIDSFHDGRGGRSRGPNTIFCFAVDGIKVCHLGDLGHQLSEEQLSDIGEVDVLLIPVGARFTIDARGASRVVAALRPRVAIPMHYHTVRVVFPLVLAKVESFLEGKPNVKILDTSEVEFKRDELPPPTQVVVPRHAL